MDQPKAGIKLAGTRNLGNYSAAKAEVWVEYDPDKDTFTDCLKLLEAQLAYALDGAEAVTIPRKGKV